MQDVPVVGKLCLVVIVVAWDRRPGQVVDLLSREGTSRWPDLILSWNSHWLLDMIDIALEDARALMKDH